MKIRKFNESLVESDFKQFELIFVDFLDKGAEIENNLDEDFAIEEYWGICIDIPVMEYDLTSRNNPKNIIYNDIQQYIDYSVELQELYLDAQVCINRVKDEFPDINVKIDKEAIDSVNRDKINSYFWIYFGYKK